MSRLIIILMTLSKWLTIYLDQIKLFNSVNLKRNKNRTLRHCLKPYHVEFKPYRRKYCKNSSVAQKKNTWLWALQIIIIIIIHTYIKFLYYCWKGTFFFHTNFVKQNMINFMLKQISPIIINWVYSILNSTIYYWLNSRSIKNLSSDSWIR